MPVLLKDYRVNDFSRRFTVYSRLKRITSSGFDTSNDLFAEGNFSRIQGLNDNSKDYFSRICSDIISFNELYVACGYNDPADKRSRLSTFLYSEDNGVSWTFSNDTFESIDTEGNSLPVLGKSLIVSCDTLFCSGSGADDDGNYGLMSSTNGKTWTKVKSPFSVIENIATNGFGKILASGLDINNINNLIIAVSSDNGGSWTPLSNNKYNVTHISSIGTQYANDRFYMGISNINTLSLYTSSDFTSWTTVQFAKSSASDHTDISPSGILDRVYYSSGKYILTLSYSTDIHIVYYSTSGDSFISSNGIDNNNFVTNITNVTYNTSDNTFYLTTQYYYTNSVPNDKYVIYKSTDSGVSWIGYLTIADLSSQLPSGSGNLTGVSQFYINNSIKFVIGTTGDSDSSNSSFAFIYFTGQSSTVSRPVFLSGKAYKLLHNHDVVLVGVGLNTLKKQMLENSIYYYSNTQRHFFPTEHTDDVS